MENFGKFCYTAILLVITIFIGSYVFLKLWQWFIMTTFDAQSITIAQAMGIMLFVGYLRPKRKTNDEEKFTIKKITKSFLETLLMAIFVLGIGWLITLFI